MKLLMCAVAVFAGCEIVASLGQAKPPQPSAGANVAIDGVQMVIMSSNCVVSAGGSIAMCCLVRNASSNSISTSYTGQVDLDFKHVFMTDYAGNVRDLVSGPINRHVTFSTRRIIPPNGVYERHIGLVVSEHSVPCVYNVSVVKSVVYKGKEHDLVANNLVLRVVVADNEPNATIIVEPGDAPVRTKGF
jgi:hypothetical protein